MLQNFNEIQQVPRESHTTNKSSHADIVSIIPANNKRIFYHGRREDDTMAELRTEFERLSTGCLQTCDQTIVEKMNLAEMTIFLFNCQSLNAHAHAKDVVMF